MGVPARNLTGLGIYSKAEAAKLLKVRAHKLGRWADGYTFYYRGRQRFSKAVIRPELPEIHGIRILTFVDLVELNFISVFREKGVSMPIIRAAAERAAHMFQTDHPFAVKGFATDGKSIFVDLEATGLQLTGMSDHKVILELHKSQRVFRFVEAFFREIDWGDQEAVRWWPLGREHRIVIDPARAFGKPIDAETGVPTLAVYEASLSGANRQRIADWYDIPVEAVVQSVRYEKELAQA